MNYVKSVLTGIALCIALGGTAVVANPERVTVTQPNGTTVTLNLHGDEYFNFTSTPDGYPVVYNAQNGTWEYATLDATGSLIADGEIASDKRHPRKDNRWQFPKRKATTATRQKLHRLYSNQYQYESFRGLVILVEFKDRPFSRPDIAEVFNDMLNKKDFDGYMSSHTIPSKIACTGSVRDYFYDNSNGVFDPEFDVIGPVKVDYSQYYARGSYGAQVLVRAALHAADSLVDYSRYDTDGNRIVDMVYFVFAGAGANYSGNNPDLLWPHASTIIGANHDSCGFGRYACSVELYGSEVSSILDGIGTFCHEFSHVLGLCDLYDTDYENNGQSIHPGRWSVMAGGSYLNKSKTPCGFSLFERESLGFAQARIINEPGDYTLAPLNSDSEAEGYIIQSSINNEYFTLENRTKTRWDEYLPGEGLLVHRVDRTNPKVWETNTVNASASHNYFELLRATPKISGKEVVDSDGDPFPGSGNITSITNTTSPASLRSWTKTPTPLTLNNISLADNDYISFSVQQEEIPMLIEDFTAMIPNADDQGARGKFTDWTFANGARIIVPEDGGDAYLSMVKGGEVTALPFNGIVENMCLYIHNTSTQGATFRLSYAEKPSGPWTTLRTATGAALPSVAVGASSELHYKVDSLKEKYYKLTQYTGSGNQACRIDCIEFTINPDSGYTDVTPIILDNSPNTLWYTMQGQAITKPTTPGLYIRRQNSRTTKVLIR